MSINLMSCRVCMVEKKPKKLRSIFSHKFEDNEVISDAIYQISGIRIDHSEASNLPTRICRNCFENIEVAKNVRKLVIQSDLYLKDLLAQGAVSYMPDQSLDILNISTDGEVKVEKLEEDYGDNDNDVDFTYEELDSYINENDQSNIVAPISVSEPVTIAASTFSDPSNFNLEERLTNMNELGNIKKEIAEEIEVKVCLNEMMENITKDSNSTAKPKGKGKKVKYKCPDTTVHQCLVCGKVYKNKYILKAHESRHYPQPQPTVKYTCDMCNREFTKKVNIYRHMQGVHFKDKKYKCQFCGKQFYNSVDFKTHVNDHQNIKEWPCMECPMRFGRKRYLEIHMRKHSGERPYQCKYCERAFSHHSDHRRHEMMHTGERPYKCSICGRGFVRRCHMLSHEKIHR